MSFNPLSVILKENQLTGPNYIDWKRNLDIVLTAEGYKFAITDACPAVPAADAPEQEKEEYARWKKADEMAKCYILASMSNVLQHQHQSKDTAADILLNLRDLALMSTRMAEGTPVREHALRVMAQLNELEVMGGYIDGETQVDIMLQSLPKSFDQFRLNYNMHKMHMALPELLAELQSAEALFTQAPQVLVAEQAGPSRPHKGRKRKKSAGKVKAQDAPVYPRPTPQAVAKKPKGRCHKCNKSGHWKVDCPLLKKGNSLVNVVETCLAVVSTRTWCVDTGATDHVCNSLQGFQETKRLREGEITVYMGNATKVAAVAVGDVTLSFDSSSLVLRNCLYVPSFRKNLVSVSKLVMDGFSVSFDDMVIIRFENRFICCGSLVGNLYVLKPNSPTVQHNELNNVITTSNKRKESSQMNQAYLWHLRLGHINLRRIQKLVASGHLGPLEEHYPTCESCLEGKMAKRPFTAKGYRSQEVLGLIHSDLCGPMSIQARGGFEYYVSFIDDYSRFGYVYLLHRKSECFEKFKEYRAVVEKLHGKCIKSLRSDRGGEYLFGEFRTYLSEAGIESQLTAPGTPQQNGVAERRNRTLMEMVRSMMSYSRLPDSFWGLALETASYILNMVPSKSVDTTPYEMWKGRKPSFSQFRVWGSPAHVLVQEPGKLEKRSEARVFVGYPKETKGGLFYSPGDQKVIVSTNARFLEEDYIMNHKPASRLVLEELRGESDGSPPSAQVDTSHNTATRHTESVPVQTVPRRSGRVSHLPDRWIGLGESSDSVPGGLESDPRTYDEALQDKDADSWNVAMKAEMGSMDSNQVWDLVELPDGVRPIGCKWIYKRKRGLDGKVQTFKARLVAKGYTQIEGIDYDETFSPVAMLKSIRILLAVAAHMDYEVWQMDVKTAFLNGNLQEDIYMQQPEGFIAEGREHLVCKLNRSIYGLKQASRSWNIRFDEVIQSYGFTQCPDEHCVYKKISGSVVVFLVLYVDDILLIGNSKKELSDVKVWLSKQFDMKDLGEAGHILGIRLIRDRKKRMLCLSQSSYIDTVLARFSMQDSKKGMLPFRHGIPLSKEMSPKTSKEIEEMKTVPYASAVGSLMYAMLCTRPDISYAVGMVARYQSNPGREHWSAVKHILKYLRRTKEYMLVYRAGSLLPLGYSDSDFQSDKDESKSTSGYVFTLGSGAISWRSAKQKCVADSTMEAEYIAASEAAKEAVWLRNFLVDLEVIPSLPRGITVYCDNSGAVANSKEPRAHRASKHIERKYHLIRDIVGRGDVDVAKIASEDAWQ
ncbi:gag-pol polyprotein [Striga asiatica]|uniref:Gag-pol polyprotein n=1 Tax=Striga asiatica TaxID=4170 RepID=A0A5A7QR34_STRAF|nr:gag-pol polyprotein [Striga asiatica]